MRCAARPSYVYAGGGTKPPISAASSRANSIVVRSSPSGPMICRPTGNPSSVKPIGAAVAGRPAYGGGQCPRLQDTVIRQSLEPLRRALTDDNQRAQRAIGLVEHSLDRLDGLVASARRLDEATVESVAADDRHHRAALVCQRTECHDKRQ